MGPDLDGELVAIAAGDPDAFGRWVAGCEERLRLSLRPLAAQLDVEAVVQETLLRVWQVAPRFQPDARPNALLRFAIRAARNLALSELRRRRAEPIEIASLERALYEAGAAAQPAEPDPLLRRWVRECCEALPRVPKRALLERLGGELARPDRVHAEKLGMRLNTFLQNVCRARRLLLACLEQHGVKLDL